MMRCVDRMRVKSHSLSDPEMTEVGGEADRDNASTASSELSDDVIPKIVVSFLQAMSIVKSLIEWVSYFRLITVNILMTLQLRHRKLTSRKCQMVPQMTSMNLRIVLMRSTNIKTP